MSSKTSPHTAAGFAAKHDIINHFADLDNWENKFDQAFFDDKKRRWKPMSINDIEVSFDRTDPSEYDGEDKKHEADYLPPPPLGAIVKHKPSGATILVEESEIGFTVTDERGVSLNSSQPYSETENNNSLEYKSSADIEHMGIMVKFTDEGQKRITFSNTNSVIELEAPHSEVSNALKQSMFFHTVHLSEAFIDALSYNKPHSLPFLHVVAALDLGLQPNLRTFNGFNDAGAILKLTSQMLDYKKSLQEDNDFENAEYLDFNALDNIGGIAALEKKWSDSAEFQGYKTEQPSFFTIEQQESGADFRTDTNGKDLALTRGLLFSKAADLSPTSSFFLDGDMEVIFKALAKGESIQDRSTRSWNIIALDLKGNFEAAKNLTNKMQDDYHLGADEFAMINLGPNQSCLAISEDVLEECLKNPESKKRFINPNAQATLG